MNIINTLQALPPLKSREDILFSSVNKALIIGHMLGPEGKPNRLLEGKHIIHLFNKFHLSTYLHPGCVLVLVLQ